MTAGEIRAPAIAKDIEEPKLDYGDDGAKKQRDIDEKSASLVKVFE